MLVPTHFALEIYVSFTASWKPVILPALPIETEAQLSKESRELRAQLSTNRKLMAGLVTLSDALVCHRCQPLPPRTAQLWPLLPLGMYLMSHFAVAEIKRHGQKQLIEEFILLVGFQRQKSPSWQGGMVTIGRQGSRSRKLRAHIFSRKQEGEQG